MERNKNNENIHDITDINILLLSATGDEKVFFINTLVNCLAYRNIEEAKQKKNLVYMIPCEFNIDDKHRQTHEISIKSNSDYYNKVDSVEIIDVKTLIVPVGNRPISLKIVYSDGLGDPRGQHHDNINFEKILYYIGQLEVLHAIFFVFNPNDSRISAIYEYWVKRLYSSLQPSVAENFAFIYTYNETTQRGITKLETLSNLKRILAEKTPNVNTQGERNVFAFDEDVFRYLAAFAYGVELELNENKFLLDCGLSFKETDRLINYIVGGKGKEPLKPYFVRDPTSINEGRRVINIMGQPIIDILQLIIDNLRLLGQRQQDFEKFDQSAETYRTKLYLPTINLRVEELEYPVTMCSHEKCLDCVLIHRVKIWNCKQKCHELCFLRNIPQEFVGGSELKFCARMDPVTQKCFICQCPKSDHIHMYYLSEKFKDSKIPTDIMEQVNTHEQLLSVVERLKREIKERRDTLNKDKKTLLQCVAKFVCFLEKHSITPFNDIYKNYMKLMISRELQLGRNGDPFIIQEWKNVLSEYTKMCESQMVNSLFDTQRSFLLDGSFVENELRKLGQLNNFGSILMKMFSCQTIPRKNEFEATYSAHSYFDLNPNTKSQNMTNIEKHDENKENIKSLQQDYQGSLFENEADIFSDMRNKLETITLSESSTKLSSIDSYSEYNIRNPIDPRNHRSSYDKPSTSGKSSSLSDHTTSQHDNRSMSNYSALQDTSFRNDRSPTQNYFSNINQPYSGFGPMYNNFQDIPTSFPNLSFHHNSSTHDNQSNVSRNSGNVYVPQSIIHIPETPSNYTQDPLNQKVITDIRSENPQEPSMSTNNPLSERTVDKNNGLLFSNLYSVPPPLHQSRISSENVLQSSLNAPSITVPVFDERGNMPPSIAQIAHHQSNPVGGNIEQPSSNAPSYIVPVLDELDKRTPYMTQVTKQQSKPIGGPVLDGQGNRPPYTPQVTQYQLKPVGRNIEHPSSNAPSFGAPVLDGRGNRLPYMTQVHHQSKPIGGNIEHPSSNEQPLFEPVLDGQGDRPPYTAKVTQLQSRPVDETIEQPTSLPTEPKFVVPVLDGQGNRPPYTAQVTQQQSRPVGENIEQPTSLPAVPTFVVPLLDGQGNRPPYTAQVTQQQSRSVGGNIEQPTSLPAVPTFVVPVLDGQGNRPPYTAQVTQPQSRPVGGNIEQPTSLPTLPTFIVPVLDGQGNRPPYTAQVTQQQSKLVGGNIEQPTSLPTVPTFVMPVLHRQGDRPPYTAQVTQPQSKPVGGNIEQPTLLPTVPTFVMPVLDGQGNRQPYTAQVTQQKSKPVGRNIEQPPSNAPQFGFQALNGRDNRPPHMAQVHHQSKPVGGNIERSSSNKPPFQVPVIDGHSYRPPYMTQVAHYHSKPVGSQLSSNAPPFAVPVQSARRKQLPSTAQVTEHQSKPVGAQLSSNAPPFAMPVQSGRGKQPPPMAQVTEHQSKPFGAQVSSNVPPFPMPVQSKRDKQLPSMGQVSENQSKPVGAQLSSNAPHFAMPIRSRRGKQLRSMAQVTEHKSRPVGAQLSSNAPPFAMPVQGGRGKRLPPMAQVTEHQSKPIGGNIEQPSSNAPSFLVPVLSGPVKLPPYIAQVTRHPSKPGDGNIAQPSSLPTVPRFVMPVLRGSGFVPRYLEGIAQQQSKPVGGNIAQPSSNVPQFVVPVMGGHGDYGLRYLSQAAQQQSHTVGRNVQQNSSNPPRFVVPVLAGSGNRPPLMAPVGHQQSKNYGGKVHKPSSNAQAADTKSNNSQYRTPHQRFDEKVWSLSNPQVSSTTSKNSQDEQIQKDTIGLNRANQNTQKQYTGSKKLYEGIPIQMTLPDNSSNNANIPPYVRESNSQGTLIQDERRPPLNQPLYIAVEDDYFILLPDQYQNLPNALMPAVDTRCRMNKNKYNKRFKKKIDDPKKYE